MFKRLGQHGRLVFVSVLFAFGVLSLNQGCSTGLQCVVDGASHAIECVGEHALTEFSGALTNEGAAVGWLHSLLHKTCASTTCEVAGRDSEHVFISCSDGRTVERPITSEWWNELAGDDFTFTSCLLSIMSSLAVKWSLAGLGVGFIAVLLTHGKLGGMVFGLLYTSLSTLPRLYGKTWGIVLTRLRKALGPRSGSGKP